MFEDEDLLPISGLQHLLFCERRAALVFMEGIWDENVYTVEGRHLHQRTESSGTESRGDVRIARELRLRSLRLGLTGKADVVEFHRLSDNPPDSPGEGGPVPGLVLEGVKGFWKAFPVEYKRGKLRREEGYEAQLCAQAICLEEMLNVEIHAGAIFYGKTKRRLDVRFDDDLRNKTQKAAARLHEIIRSGETPAARYEKKCEKCSLLTLCMPKAVGAGRSIRAYLDKALAETQKDSK